MLIMRTAGLLARAIVPQVSEPLLRVVAYSLLYLN